MNFLFIDFPWLSWLLFLPTLGAIGLLFFPSDRPFDSVDKTKGLKRFVFIIFLLNFLFSLPLFFEFSENPLLFSNQEGPSWSTRAILQDDKIIVMEESLPWLELDQLGISASYFLRVDGINILLILLTTILFPIIFLASWNSIAFRVKEFSIAMLLMETGILGAFFAWDLLLFYIFWEWMLIPMYFIIGIWGSEDRVYAAVKFFIYTIAGSLILFLALLFIYQKVGSFHLTDIYAASGVFRDSFQFLGMTWSLEHLLFLAFALSFAIKVPMFPFHTWLPDAHVQAPAAGSVVLAGVLLKMGTYGFIRFAIPFFPNASLDFAPAVSILACISILYGAWMALAQSDMKKLIAYSSISHLGFVMLGLFAFSSQNVEPGVENIPLLSKQAIQGALYQMINHGISTGALFLLVGMLYDRRHTREIQNFGGLAQVMPIFAVIFMISTLSSVGLPGLNGFVGEFLILLGVFQVSPVYSILASLGVVFAAVYLFLLYQKLFFGTCKEPENLILQDLSPREIFAMIPLILLMVFMGIMPSYFLNKMEFTLQNLFYNLGWLS